MFPHQPELKVCTAAKQFNSPRPFSESYPNNQRSIRGLNLDTDLVIWRSIQRSEVILQDGKTIFLCETWHGLKVSVRHVEPISLFQRVRRQMSIGVIVLFTSDFKA